MNLRLYNWVGLDSAARDFVLQRPFGQNNEIRPAVAEIIASVREDGDEALKSLTLKFDGCELENLEIKRELIEAATQKISEEVSTALQAASQTISTFHQADVPGPCQVETVEGMYCESRYQPIDTVGLYIPGGTAPLVSTVLMLAIPAKIAGCKNIVLCTPPGPEGHISTELLAAIALCEIENVYSIGGAQAIAAMAYGTPTVPRCDKIFGPGNAWVTEAKQQVSIDPEGAAIDLPAGPSEVLIIADNQADPDAVSWDLLSQAEHGPDSQVILLTDSDELARLVSERTTTLAGQLPRLEILEASLKSSRIIVTSDIDEAVGISNRYGPEHLIINTTNARVVADRVRNAGSVFIGPWTPESLGDYCSGTNHVLPTYGWSRSHGALGVTDFMRRFTLQEATPMPCNCLGQSQKFSRVSKASRHTEWQCATDWREGCPHEHRSPCPGRNRGDEAVLVGTQ